MKYLRWLAMTSVFLVLLPGCNSSGRMKRTFAANEVPMTAVVDSRNRMILVSGAIGSNDNIIQVVIPDVPNGRWTVIKSETNLTDAPWRSWEIVFGENTHFSQNPDSVVSSQFRSLDDVQGRNAIVFSNGEVLPGAAVLKIFQVDHRGLGMMEMSHNRNGLTATPAMIRDGFPRLPVKRFVLETRRLK